MRLDPKQSIQANTHRIAREARLAFDARWAFISFVYE
jgi:hypothetical protein